MFDLSIGILLDMVFDFVGVGGDVMVSCFMVNSGVMVIGLIVLVDFCLSLFSVLCNGGFDVMSISFMDFDLNEVLFYIVDVDFNSI